MNPERLKFKSPKGIKMLYFRQIWCLFGIDLIIGENIDNHCNYFRDL